MEDRLAEEAIKILSSSKEEVEKMVASNAFILTEMEEKAKAKGKEEGVKEGEIKKASEVAKNLLLMGLDILTVIKATGLTEEDVKKIKDELH